MLSMVESVSKNIQAFRDAVARNADDPVMFLDPNGIPKLDMQSIINDPVAGYGIYDHLAKAKENIETALKESYPDITFPNVAISGLAAHHNFGKGPAVLPDLSINDDKYCLAYSLEEGFATKGELIKTFLGELYDERVLQNFPGAAESWFEAVGMHEAGHCNDHSMKERDLTNIHNNDLSEAKALSHEIEGDKHVIEVMSRESPEMVSAYIDLRHLRAAQDPKHATGPYLETAEGIMTQIHIDAAMHFNDYSEDELREMAQQNQINYNYNPSDDNMRSLLQTQYMMNYKTLYLDAYDRRINGIAPPERQLVRFVEPEDEQIFLKKQKDLEIQNSKPQESFNFSYNDSAPSSEYSTIDITDTEAQEGAVSEPLSIDDLGAFLKQSNDRIMSMEQHNSSEPNNNEANIADIKDNVNIERGLDQFKL